MGLLTISTALVVCVTCLIFLFVWKKSHRGGRLPPGPTPLPIIGNMLQLNLRDIPASLSRVRNFDSGLWDDSQVFSSHEHWSVVFVLTDVQSSLFYRIGSHLEWVVMGVRADLMYWLSYNI